MCGLGKGTAMSFHLLDERGETYGVFSGNARIAQRLKDDMRSMPKWHGMDADQREALELIATKIARILNGNPNHLDSWADIRGYAQLVERRLAGEAL
jgi:hypothetical protein